MNNPRIIIYQRYLESHLLNSFSPNDGLLTSGPDHWLPWFVRSSWRHRYARLKDLTRNEPSAYISSVADDDWSCKKELFQLQERNLR